MIKIQNMSNGSLTTKTRQIMKIQNRSLETPTRKKNQCALEFGIIYPTDQTKNEHFIEVKQSQKTLNILGNGT